MVSVMPTSADTPLTLRIARKSVIATDIVAFELVSPDNENLPEFTPGAHIAVTTPSGKRRKYSLCNAPSERGHYEIAVKREPHRQSGSSSLIDGARVGDALEASVPQNNFPLSVSQAGYVLIAGGIGITPLISMIRHLRDTGDARFNLYYCTRSPEHTAFREELSAPEMRGKVVMHHDGGSPERRFDFWPVLESPLGRQVYCCGPQTLMREVQDMTGHWSSTAVHFETFTESSEGRPNDRPFRVRLARSGEVVEIPVGATILETLRSRGYDLRSSCESGTCGTCITRYLSGEPDHRDFVLHEAGRATDIMICVSRARSDELTLDL
jgi:phthalate 4,5-dioxygenase reductase subunit